MCFGGGSGGSGTVRHPPATPGGEPGAVMTPTEVTTARNEGLPRVEERRRHSYLIDGDSMTRLPKQTLGG